MEHYASIIAKELGMDKVFQEEILNAAYFTKITINRYGDEFNANVPFLFSIS